MLIPSPPGLRAIGWRTAPRGFHRGLVTCLLVMLAAGCTSRARARREAQEAFQQGAARSSAQLQQTQNTVLVRGPVTAPLVPWRPGLRLSQAILHAKYTRMTDPTRIVVVRQNLAHPVKVRDLLKGLEDPELQPGDVIDIQ